MAMRLRVNVASEKNTQAVKITLGTTITTIENKYGASEKGPTLSGSSQGITLPTMMASTTNK